MARPKRADAGRLTPDQRKLLMWWPVLPLKVIVSYFDRPSSTIRSRAGALGLPPKKPGPPNRSGRVYAKRSKSGHRNKAREALKPGDQAVYDALRARGESHADALAWLQG